MERRVDQRLKVDAGQHCLQRKKEGVEARVQIPWGKRGRKEKGRGLNRSLNKREKRKENEKSGEGREAQSARAYPQFEGRECARRSLEGGSYLRASRCKNRDTLSERSADVPLCRMRRQRPNRVRRISFLDWENNTRVHQC